MLPEEGAMLSEAEVATYHRDGLVVPDYRLPGPMIERMRGSLEGLIRDNPEVPPDAMYCPHILNGGTQGLAGGADWLEYARIPDVLEMTAQLIGPDILLWGTTVFGKPAGTGKEVPWHQDGQYWPIEPLATCSVWIALDDAGPENGCLRFIPGSHRERRVFGHATQSSGELVLNQRIDDAEFDEAKARDVVLEAGQMSFHDIYLVHGSRPNRSGRRRAGYVLRYLPTTSVFDHARGAELAARSGNVVDFATRPLFLVRGIDRSGRNDLEVGH
jgi:hypothetical protein